MPPKLLADLSRIDLTAVLFGKEEIRECVPQRFEMEMLDAVHHLDPRARLAVGSKKVGEDEWWARGHIPGRPLFPGVLMIEGAAQLSTWLFRRIGKDPRFIGLGAVDGVRFRGKVVPGDTLVLLARLKKLRSRKAVFDCQGVVEGRLVFQAAISGMAV